MKTYFAKYLPVEGEIKEGDKVHYKNEFMTSAILCEAYRHKNDERILLDDGDCNREIGEGITPLPRDVKKVKLFLCSRDNSEYKQEILTEGIKEGQEFTEQEKDYLTLL